MAMKGSFAASGAGGRDDPAGGRRRALPREVRDPRVGFVTVTHVQVTNDLSHARVHGERPGRRGGQGRGRSRGSRARRASSAAGWRRRSPPASCRNCTSSSTAGWSTRRGSTSCSTCADRARGGAGLIGALLVDKPAGPTSHDVVRARAARAGDAGGGSHRNAGSVRDRTAGGAGRAGHAARPVRRGGRPRRYRPPLRLGVADRHRRPHRGADRGAVPDAVAGRRPASARRSRRFAGTQQQRPPALLGRSTSDGERSYRLARRGERWSSRRVDGDGARDRAASRGGPPAPTFESP